jgi:predicted DNA-binding transcriptional regulator AlpA
MTALTESEASAIAVILERAAAEIRTAIGSSGNGLADLGDQLAHVHQHDVLLTPANLAAMLQINERSLRRMRSAGQIPEPIWVGKLPRWKRDIVLRWLEERAEE